MVGGKKSEILLFSGGLDSFILYFYLKKPRTLYFNLGHRYAHKELEVVSKLIKNTEVDFSYTLTDWELPDAHIPFRNVLLAMGASRYADIVYLGGVSDDRVNDNTRVAHADMTSFISRYAGRFVRVAAPFAEQGWSKFDAVRWFKRELGKKADRLLLQTLSCYSSRSGRCMKCAACFRWWVALKWCGVQGVPQFQNATHVARYVDKVERGEITGERAKAIIEGAKKWINE